MSSSSNVPTTPPSVDPVAEVVARWSGTQVEVIPLEVTYTLAAVLPEPATIVRAVPPEKRMQALRDGMPKAQLPVVPAAAFQQAMGDLQTLVLVAAARATILLQLRGHLVAGHTAALTSDSPAAGGWAGALAALDELTGGHLVPAPPGPQDDA